MSMIQLGMLLQLVVRRLFKRVIFFCTVLVSESLWVLHRQHVTWTVYLNSFWGTWKWKCCVDRQLARFLNPSNYLWLLYYFCLLCLFFLSFIYNNPHFMVDTRAPALTRLSSDKRRHQSRRKLLPADNTLLS